MPERRTLAHDAADWALARSVQVAGVAGVVALAADKHDVVYQRAFGLRAVDQPPVSSLVFEQLTNCDSNSVPQPVLAESWDVGGDYRQIKGNYFVVGLNTHNAPFDNKKVRQAMNYAFDRQRFTDTATYGSATPSSLMWRQGSPAYEATKANAYPFDVNRARTLLQDAGVAQTPSPLSCRR